MFWFRDSHILPLQYLHHGKQMQKIHHLQKYKYHKDGNPLEPFLKPCHWCNRSHYKTLHFFLLPSSYQCALVLQMEDKSFRDITCFKLPGIIKYPLSVLTKKVLNFTRGKCFFYATLPQTEKKYPKKGRPFFIFQNFHSRV